MHALKKTHRLLIRGGLLIEVHDEPVSPSLALQFRDEIFNVGRLHDSSGFERLRQTAEAVEQVNRDDLFKRVESQIMEYQIYIDSLDSFDDWLSRQWDTTYLENGQYEIIGFMQAFVDSIKWDEARLANGEYEKWYKPISVKKHLEKRVIGEQNIVEVTVEN